MLEYHDNTDSAYYTGPLEAGKRLAGQYDDIPVVSRTDSGKWRVETGNSFGVADSLEGAWRYYLGAEFGPIDENYSREILIQEIHNA